MKEGLAAGDAALDELAQFDLTEEMADSDRRKPWAMGHLARTLFKKSDFRTVLISMEPGSIMKEHQANGSISVQVLKGAIRFTVRGRAHDLRPTNLLMLGASIRHEVEALEESAFLLTIAWSNTEKVEAMKNQQSEVLTDKS